MDDQKMYYNGREILAILSNRSGCSGCLFHHDTCHAIGRDNYLCWSEDEDGEYVKGSDVVFKFKENVE
jgi:hypothetical protein